MLHELELVFARDEESGKPFLATLDKSTNELHEAILEDIIDSHVKGSQPVAVLVTYHDDSMDIDMNELFKRYFNLIKKKIRLTVETADGKKGRFVKKLSNPEYPYMIMFGAEGDEMPFAYTPNGECCTGKDSDKIVKYHEEDPSANDIPKKEEAKKADVDGDDFPEEVPEDVELKND